MDYHVVFARMIGASFERATCINLTRHPYGQCESLMRIGLSLESACRWYNDVARMMADLSQSGAIGLRFEDVVTRLMETCDELYRSLGVRWSEDGSSNSRLSLMAPVAWPTWASRTGRSSSSAQTKPRTKIDASVLGGERERPSDRAIWNLTGAAATRFSYTVSGVLPGVT
jgi:hypothetical protein